MEIEAVQEKILNADRLIAANKDELNLISNEIRLIEQKREEPVKKENDTAKEPVKGKVVRLVSRQRPEVPLQQPLTSKLSEARQSPVLI